MADAPKLTPEELLSMLVFNLQQSAMVAMGKLKNPVTGKVERHLQDAGFSIDMLQMLADKMKGNLDDVQERNLQQALTMLRLNFVDEQQKPAAAETSDTTTDQKTEATGAEASDGDDGRNDSPDAADSD